MMATTPSIRSVLFSFAGLRLPAEILGEGDIGGHPAGHTQKTEYSGWGSSCATMARPISVMAATMPSMRSVDLSLAGLTLPAGPGRRRRWRPFGPADYAIRIKTPPSAHQADDDARAGERWRLAAFLPPSEAPAANAPGALMLFQVVSIQRSERWRWEMRKSSMWPLRETRRRSRAGRCRGQLN
jgi:hypothetical protein